MLKGFIDYKGGRIPFVAEKYRLELFTDDNLLNDFTAEYNHKTEFILYGQCFDNGFASRGVAFMVEESLGCTCYLRCYYVTMLATSNSFDAIGFQSSSLDDVFNYKYKCLELTRTGLNLSVNPETINTIRFNMDDKEYCLSYRVGYNNQLGLLEDMNRKGELLILLQSHSISEYYNLAVVLYRLSIFMVSNTEAFFKRIVLYKNGLPNGWFYCRMASEESISVRDVLFHEFDVERYLPKILNNIALDSGNKITRSIPLGHIMAKDSFFSPQRFMEQVMSFEYLFDKLEHTKAQDRTFSLKQELVLMLNAFPQLLIDTNQNAEDVSEQIKEIRRKIAHGYEYYYDFEHDYKIKMLMLKLDKLIKCMSLKWIGFAENDISDFAHLTF